MGAHPLEGGDHMRKRTAQLALIATAFLFGMSGSRPQAQTNTERAQPVPIQINGLSVVPPTVRGWVRGPSGQGSFQIEFFKQIGDSTYLLNGELRDVDGMPLSNADEVLAYLKMALQESPRQENMKTSFAIESTFGAPCASFDMQAEDSHSPRRPGVTFDIEAHGLYCVHPIASGVLAIIEYSRRAPRGQAHAGERSEGEEFIRGVKFTAVSR
jgi:hypothetical protein